MSLKSHFASRLIEARTALHLTQAQVAESVSISIRWYQKLEKGVFLPGNMVMLRLMLLLHIDSEEFREEVGLLEPVSIHTR